MTFFLLLINAEKIFLRSHLYISLYIFFFFFFLHKNTRYSFLSQHIFFYFSHQITSFACLLLPLCFFFRFFPLPFSRIFLTRKKVMLCDLWWTKRAPGGELCETVKNCENNGFMPHASHFLSLVFFWKSFFLHTFLTSFTSHFLSPLLIWYIFQLLYRRPFTSVICTSTST